MFFIGIEIFNKKFNWILSLRIFDLITNNLRKQFKKFGIQLVTRPNLKLSHLVNIKEKINKENKSGIYKVNCNYCSDFYIGQTSRNFKERFKEHERHARLNHPKKSTIAKHHIQEHAKFKLEEKCLEVIQIVNQNYKLDAWESFHIQNSTFHNKPIIN